ncbi:MAG: sugar phosphate isomerase/epimerase [Acidobacteriia bacterium]|nr:sugar phosphate isomerase/epimerase [Terriglobia bacterium]
MKTISRRGFLGKSVVGIVSAGYLTRGGAELRADPLGLPIGCQTWPVRESLGKDFDGTLRQLAAEGFRTIEMCSPPGYKDLGFGPLVSMKASEMRERIHAAGLKCESCHYGFTELTEHLDERLAYAKELGLKQMIISTFWLPKGATLADWMRAAGEANKLGERTRQAGVQLGFHNHNFEFQKLDGQLIYDKLMGELDLQAVKMQFQVAVVELGYQAADYFEKYPGRFISMHLADWSPEKKKEVPLGQGIVDWKKTFAAAQIGGVKNSFVEMDPDAMKASVPFLHTLS